MTGADDGDFGAFEGTHGGENFAGGARPAAVEADPARAAKVGSTRATVEAAIGDLAAQLARPAEAEQPSLMLDEMDEQMALFAGPVRHVADRIAGARGRGRPRGSTNRNAFRDVALRMGYRHPGLNLLAIANADPETLARELATDKAGAMSLIMRANAELMPYFEGKAAQKVEVEAKSLGVMLIGEINAERQAEDVFLNLTSVAKPE